MTQQLWLVRDCELPLGISANRSIAWDKVHVDIVVHASPQGSGNLKRLLRSLAQVDMGAMPVPHLTIELPHRIDPQAEKFISTYQWPPKTGIGGHRPHMLSLRHRIPRQSLSAEESSVRFLESFWPRNPRYSYVLVLSPNTEVTPQFLHCASRTLEMQNYLLTMTQT